MDKMERIATDKQDKPEVGGSGFSLAFKSAKFMPSDGKSCGAT